MGDTTTLSARKMASSISLATFVVVVLCLAHVHECYITSYYSCGTKRQYLCGTDGRTYMNMCSFRKAHQRNHRIIVDHYGVCCKKCFSYIYEAICASDGITYDNTCEFNRARCLAYNKKSAKPTMKHYGKCIKECTRACKIGYHLLCASDGKTYANLCTFKNAQCKNNALTVKSEGVCGRKPAARCEKACGRIKLDICGTDGETYDNRCQLENARCKTPSLAVAHQGRCVVKTVKKEKKSCRRFCFKNINWVCGSDGVSYHNECLLLEEKCKNNPSLAVAHQGSCVVKKTEVKTVKKKKKSCRRFCFRNIDWVCGSDGVSYHNECILLAEQCTNNPSLRVAKRGEC